jgi:hypothetical protein
MRRTANLADTPHIRLVDSNGPRMPLWPLSILHHSHSSVLTYYSVQYAGSSFGQPHLTPYTSALVQDLRVCVYTGAGP